MNRFDYLKRFQIGFDDDGNPIYSERSYRAFIISLILGGRGIAMNIKIDGTILAKDGDIIANNTFLKS